MNSSEWSGDSKVRILFPENEALDGYLANAVEEAFPVSENPNAGVKIAIPAGMTLDGYTRAIIKKALWPVSEDAEQEGEEETGRA